MSPRQSVVTSLLPNRLSFTEYGTRADRRFQARGVRRAEINDWFSTDWHDSENGSKLGQ